MTRPHRWEIGVQGQSPRGDEVVTTGEASDRRGLPPALTSTISECARPDLDPGRDTGSRPCQANLAFRPSSMRPSPHAVLTDAFGLPSFRREQAAIVDHVVAGGDALVLMPTGGGKSLCYQIPALCRFSDAVREQARAIEMARRRGLDDRTS